MKTSRTASLLALFSALLLVSIGCKEQDVPYVIDEDEIERYVRESGEAAELFRADHLVVPEPYTLPFDDATYYDSVLSQKRSIEVSAEDTPVDYGSLGELREALVRVEDTVYVRTTRITGTDTTVAERKRLFVRHGFFLKLGDDGQSYVGWVLYGFNGYNVMDQDSTSVKMYDANGSLFFGDKALYNRSMVSITGPTYVRLSEIKSIPNGSKIRFEVKSRRRPILTPETDSGYFNFVMKPQGGNVYIDTVKTPSNNTTLYNLILVNPVSDTTGVPFRSGIFAPYKVEQ